MRAVAEAFWKYLSKYAALSASFQALNRYNSFWTFTFVLFFLPFRKSVNQYRREKRWHSGSFLVLNKPNWWAFCGWWTSPCMFLKLQGLEEAFKIIKSNHKSRNLFSHPHIWFIPLPKAAQPCPQDFSAAVTGALVSLEPCPSNVQDRNGQNRSRETQGWM